MEDEQFLRSFLEKKFKSSGFDVSSAIDGDDALAKVIASKPDLIILDLILPKKTGFEVLAEIRKDPTMAKVPVLVVSNLGQAGDVEKVKKLGVTGYFIKANLSLDELVKEAQKALPVSPPRQ